MNFNQIVFPVIITILQNERNLLIIIFSKLSQLHWHETIGIYKHLRYHCKTCRMSSAARTLLPSLSTADFERQAVARLSACQTITEGNARESKDIEAALRRSKATDVIVSVGNGDSVKKSDIREANAKALAAVMKKPEFSDVRVMLVSSNGAGESVIKVGMGIGSLISYHLRHVLSDHTQQENALQPFRQRLTVVRPTSLTDNAPTGRMEIFGDKVKPPTIKTDRADVANWVVREICENGHATMGRTVNITGIPNTKK